MRLAIALLAATTVAASAQPVPGDLPPDVQTALARPISPAAIALLLPHVSQPAVAQRLALALRDANPHVRAVAARIAFTTRQQNLVEPIAAALDVESAPLSAAEMVRALALIAGPAADARSMKAIDRLGHGPATAWIDVVGRTRPRDALDHLATLGVPADSLVTRLAATDTADVARAFSALQSTATLQSLYVAVMNASIAAKRRWRGQPSRPG